jgi:hypothetical protein
MAQRESTKRKAAFILSDILNNEWILSSEDESEHIRDDWIRMIQENTVEISESLVLFPFANVFNFSFILLCQDSSNPRKSCNLP